MPNDEDGMVVSERMSLRLGSYNTKIARRESTCDGLAVNLSSYVGNKAISFGFDCEGMFGGGKFRREGGLFP